MSNELTIDIIYKELCNARYAPEYEEREGLERIKAAMGQSETNCHQLKVAAKAVIDRWDSPSWKDLPHTADYIHALRKAVQSVTDCHQLVPSEYREESEK